MFTVEAKPFLGIPELVLISECFFLRMDPCTDFFVMLGYFKLLLAISSKYPSSLDLRPSPIFPREDDPSSSSAGDESSFLISCSLKRPPHSCFLLLVSFELCSVLVLLV